MNTQNLVYSLIFSNFTFLFWLIILLIRLAKLKKDITLSFNATHSAFEEVHKNIQQAFDNINTVSISATKAVKSSIDTSNRMTETLQIVEEISQTANTTASKLEELLTLIINGKKKANGINTD